MSKPQPIPSNEGEKPAGPDTGAERDQAQRQGGPKPAKDPRAESNPGSGRGAGQGNKGARAQNKPQEKSQIVVAETPTVAPARWKLRHTLIVLSFILMVLAPCLGSAYYLWTRAADQYISRVGFSVRTEEANSAIELLGGITNLSGSSSSDTDILYAFLQSQELVEHIDQAVDLRRVWSRVDPSQDPVFAYHPPGTVEDLIDHWQRQVRIYYDGSSGLIDLEVLAYDPQDARTISRLIFEESSEMINQLSAIAREDSISYARDELEQAEERLASARIALAEWRNENQTIDPTADTAGQMGLVTNLQAQLAEAMIELDILRDTTRENDPRITQAERRIAVIQDRIETERAVLGANGPGESAFADLVGDYERLVVDLEFAEQAYTTSLAAYDSARNEARRQSRYLAAHVRPTLAEASEYPDRPVAISILALFLFLIWTVVVLVAYSLRDRR